jgi:hypothetical protein
VEYLKTDYTDIPNPDGLKGEDLFVYITNIISEFQRESDFLNPDPDILTTLEIYPGDYVKSPVFDTEIIEITTPEIEITQPETPVFYTATPVPTSTL